MASVSGGDALAAKLRELGDKMSKAHEVRVGFLETATYADGTPVAMVAAINNFGAPEAGIPARPFFSDMIADNKDGWGDSFGDIIKAVDFDAQKALELMGEGMAGQLKMAIEAFTSVPNSPVTDLLKQRFPKRDGMTFADVLQAHRDVADGKRATPGKPLIWSGDMRDAVDKEVE